MFDVADAAIGAVCVERFPTSVLRAHLCGELARWSRMIYAVGLRVDSVARDGIFLDVVAESGAINTLARQVEEVALGEFAEDAEDAASTIFLLYGIFLPVGGKFAEERHFS